MPTTFPSNVPDPDPPPSSDRPEAPLDSGPPKDHISRSLSILTSGHATAVASGADASPVSAALVAEPWTSANSPSSSVGLGLNDIEMDSVTPSGHRRRRSSLINPANASNSRHRSRSLSTRRPANADDEDKIVEESSDDESLRPGEVDEDELTDEDLHDDEEAGLTGKDRRRKRRKRRRNQLLDQRIARDDGISPEEKQEADRTVVRSLVINGVLIGLWYFFSLLISLVWTSTLTFLVF